MKKIRYRFELINYLGKYINAKTYLEIGVKYGSNFKKINIKNKLGVDPNPLLVNENIYRMTSDEFFKKYNSLFKLNKIDIVFIDGLHTFRQSLKDVINCEKYLSKSGYIILHDCNPLKEVRAINSMTQAKKHLDWDNKWNGDVWKTIVYLRSKRKDLDIGVYNIDEGLGVVKKGKPQKILKYSYLDVAGMEYEFLNNNRKNLLNIRDVNELPELNN